MRPTDPKPPAIRTDANRREPGPRVRAGVAAACALPLAVTLAQPAGADTPAPETPVAAPPVVGADRAATGCTGTAYVYGVRQDSTLTFAAINAGTNARTRKLTGAKLPWPVRALTALDYRTLLVATTQGALYRIDITNNTNRLTSAAPVPMAYSGWGVDKLAADGAGHVFATVGPSRQLFRWDIAGTKPSGGQFTGKVRIGSGFHLNALAGVGGGLLLGTTPSGRLNVYRAKGANSFTTTMLRTSGWSGITGLASPGGGLFYARSASSGSLTTRRDPAIANSSGGDIVEYGAVDSGGWSQKLIASAPRTVRCGGGSTGGGITYDALVTMFGSNWVADRETVEAGLPSLKREMATGSINNAARRAAFLATLVSESAMRYNADQGGSYTYRGRGYIQLTNDFNYESAGDYFDINLLSQPDLAKSLRWSAPIARWYWTVARTTTNACADAFDMHCVNRNIGFAWYYEEATRRCDRFKSAYRYFTGRTPANVICYPARLPREGSTDWYPHAGSLANLTGRP